MIRCFFLFIVSMIISTLSYALPFTVVPLAGTTLPTQVTLNHTTTATYTVTNKTLRTLPNGFVKYLPPNVTQVPGAGPICGKTFSLASGASCNLNLLISGAVNANDPDPHHHLFVCTPNVPACAGTSFPLNVVVIPSLNSIAVTPATEIIATTATVQYTAVGTYSDGSTKDLTTTVTWSSSNTSAATINSSGLATGTATAPNSVTTISAVSGNITGTATLTVRPQVAYITSPSANHVSTCPINADGSFAACTAFTDPTLNGPTGIVLNSNYTFAYIVNQLDSPASISICPVNVDGSLGTCENPVSIDTSLFTPEGIAINPANSLLYIANNGNNTVAICQISTDGSSLGQCIPTTDANINFPTDVQLNSAGTVAYVTNGDDTIAVCAVNQDGSFGVSSIEGTPCTLSGSGFSTPIGIVLNGARTEAYVSDGTAALTVCGVNTDGSFSTCTPITPSGLGGAPQGIGLNAANTRLYVATGTGGASAVNACPIPGPDSSPLGACTANTDASFAGPFSAYVH